MARAIEKGATYLDKLCHKFYDVNGNYLLSALQAAKISAGESFRQPVILEFRSNTEPILLRTNKEDIKMVLPVRIKEG